jgi:hypothetical protein
MRIESHRFLLSQGLVRLGTWAEGRSSFPDGNDRQNGKRNSKGNGTSYGKALIFPFCAFDG